jgi:hypothetical protein
VRGGKGWIECKESEREKDGRKGCDRVGEGELAEEKQGTRGTTGGSVGDGGNSDMQ